MQPIAGMKHEPNDFERAPMPEAQDVSRALKAVAGRTATRSTPVEVRAHHVTIDQHHRDYVCDKLGRKLGKFAPAIERIVVRFDDVNGEKGGVDRLCRIQVSLSGMGTVIVEETNVDPITAFDLAEERVMVAIEHRLGRVRDGHIHAAMRAHEAEKDALTSVRRDEDATLP